MIHPSLSTRVVLAAVLALAVGEAGSSAAAGAPERPSLSSAVTLITGDRVRLTTSPDGMAAVAIRPGPGREDLAFFGAARTAADGTEEVTVIPSDAVPLLKAGRLEARLFEVARGPGGGKRPLAPPVGPTLGEPESHDLTVQVIDRGALPFHNRALLLNLETGESFFIFGFDETGRATVPVPAGIYDINAINSSADPGEPQPVLFETVLSAPGTVVAADTTVTLDARLGQRLSVAVDRPAVGRSQTVGLASRVAGGGISIFSVVGGNAQVFAVPTAEVTGRTYLFHYAAALASGPPDAPPGPDDYTYGLAFVENGRIPEQLSYRVHDRELAAVRTTYRVQAVPATVFRGDIALIPGLGGGTLEYPMTLPRRRTEYFTARSGIPWFHSQTMLSEEDPRGEETISTREYRPGAYQVAWNRAPLGPALGATFLSGAFRNPDGSLSAAVSLFGGNEEGHVTDSGSAAGVSGGTKLSRDGQTLGATDRPCQGFFRVGFVPASLTLACSATRQVPWSALGTLAAASWTFQDPGTGPPAARLPLPLLTVRIQGAVDAADTAPAGRWFPVLLRVERQAGSAEAEVSALELEVSYDDGATWRAVPVLRLAGRGLALLRHPPADGFVSLRTHAADSAGNSVSQTVVRAYRISGS
jgi:hypothetical protein